MENGFNDNHRNRLKQIFSPLFDDRPITVNPPKLAHYTSITTLESIMRTEEIWFSNPLFMNDFEELRFGLQEGARLFWKNEAIKQACGSEERFNKLAHHFSYFAEMREYDLDVYVFCLSEHDNNNNDGLLSMWRAYGDNGNGAALVIDIESIENIETSRLLFSPVKYFSSKKRLEIIESKLNKFARLMSPLELDDNLLWLEASIIFDYIKLFALTSKHHGFNEEKEWRFIYLKEKSIKDELWPMLGYMTGKNGLEPKLKLRLESINGVNFSLDNIIDRIILGPTNWHHTVESTVIKMLEKVGLNDLKYKVKVSEIPYRER